MANKKDDLRTRLMATFRVEAEEHLQALGTNLMALERGVPPAEALALDDHAAEGELAPRQPAEEGLARLAEGLHLRQAHGPGRPLERVHLAERGLAGPVPASLHSGPPRPAPGTCMPASPAMGERSRLAWTHCSRRLGASG